MRGLVVSIVFVLVVSIGFVAGILSGATAIGLAGFCLSPLAFIALGWTLHASGIRVTAGETRASRPLPAVERGKQRRAPDGF